MAWEKSGDRIGAHPDPSACRPQKPPASNQVLFDGLRQSAKQVFRLLCESFSGISVLWRDRVMGERSEWGPETEGMGRALNTPSGAHWKNGCKGRGTGVQGDRGERELRGGANSKWRERAGGVASGPV